MIPKRYVEAFKADYAPSLVWIKTAPEEELDTFLQGYHPTTPMWRHQKVGLILGICFPQLAYFLEMGLGKSKIVLDVYNHEYQQRKAIHQALPRGLILVPNLTNIAGWEEQITTHTPHLKGEYLFGSSVERAEILDESNADLFVINYAGLNTLASQLQPQPGKKRSKRVPIQRVIKHIGDLFDFLICDESTALKNHHSLTYLICRDLSKRIPRRYLLTGTPFGKDPHDLWSQYYVLDHGKTLGKTLGIFRAAYFSTKKNYWGGFEYKFLERSRKHLANKLEGASLRYRTEECIDLPDLVTTPILLPKTEEMSLFYGKVTEAARKQAITLIEIENHFARLRQIASGYVKHEDAYIDFRENPKLDATLELIRETPEEAKVVVFHFFTHTGELISNALRAEKVKHARIWGGTKDKAAVLKQFQTEPSCRVLIINESIGAMGLNLQIANYMVFYECPLGLIKLQQALARCRRPGQKHTVFCYFPMMKGSVDEKIYEYGQKGMNLLKELLDKKTLFTPTEKSMTHETKT